MSQTLESFKIDVARIIMNDYAVSQLAVQELLDKKCKLLRFCFDCNLSEYCVANIMVLI